MAVAMAGAAQGQSFDFEAPTYTGSAAGTVMTGTAGWYVPAVAGSTDGKVYTYTGNSLGFPVNAGGGDQFQAGTGGVSLFARAQIDLSFAAGGVWEVEYDFAGQLSGVLPATDNIGSWSTQDSAISRGFQSLMTWGTVATTWVPPATNYAATGDKFHHAIGYYATAAATAITQATPSAAWRDLLVNNWYHVRIRWDFKTARILECAIQDITGGGAVQVTDVSANNWYLRGGACSTLPLPTAMRLFGGGNSTALANSCAFDNLKIGPVSVCYADCNKDSALTVADFGCFQTQFVAGNCYTDCNNDNALTVADFGCFQTQFVSGCP
jgi:hypothetical protein